MVVIQSPNDVLLLLSLWASCICYGSSPTSALTLSAKSRRTSLGDWMTTMMSSSNLRARLRLLESRSMSEGELDIQESYLNRVDLTADEPTSAVDHPSHYHAQSGVEVIDAVEAWGLGFCLGNVIKYVARAGHKGDAREDLQKALWYLTRELSRYKD